MQSVPGTQNNSRSELPANSGAKSALLTRKAPSSSPAQEILPAPHRAPNSAPSFPASLPAAATPGSAAQSAGEKILLLLRSLLPRKATSQSSYSELFRTQYGDSCNILVRRSSLPGLPCLLSPFCDVELAQCALSTYAPCTLGMERNYDQKLS